MLFRSGVTQLLGYLLGNEAYDATSVAGVTDMTKMIDANYVVFAH